MNMNLGISFSLTLIHFALGIVVDNDDLLGSVLLGEIHGFHYKVGGIVYALNDSSLYIKNFNYSGGGPDAFFWVGIDGTPDQTNDSTTAILAYPFEGKHYQYQDKSAPILEMVENTDVTLVLPPHIAVDDIAWLSVWCRAFRANFGQLIFEKKSSEKVVQISTASTITIGTTKSIATTLKTTTERVTNVPKITSSVDEVVSTPQSSTSNKLEPRKGKDLDDEVDYADEADQLTGNSIQHLIGSSIVLFLLALYKVAL